MVLCLFDFVNNGVVEALGGNGAAASGAGGNGGGGGGGAGGFINILARYRSGNGTVNVSGGAGGAAIGASGVAGVAGNHGHINPFWAYLLLNRSISRSMYQTAFWKSLTGTSSFSPAAETHGVPTLKL